MDDKFQTGDRIVVLDAHASNAGSIPNGSTGTVMGTRYHSINSRTIYEVAIDGESAWEFYEDTIDFIGPSEKDVQEAIASIRSVTSGT